MSLEMLDVGQANELKLAFRRNGWTNQEIKKLCEGYILTDVLKVVLGFAKIQEIEQVIDCDADPFIPSEWRVEEHRKGGQFKFDPKEVRLYLSEPQRNGRTIESVKLQKELADKPVLNANILDYLLAHPHLIPEEWKRDSEGRTRHIFFWGTIYRLSGGRLFVRSLYWDGGRWVWGYGWLGFDWNVYHPAALRASK